MALKTKLNESEIKKVLNSIGSRLIKAHGKYVSKDKYYIKMVKTPSVYSRFNTMFAYLPELKYDIDTSNYFYDLITIDCYSNIKGGTKLWANQTKQDLKQGQSN